MPIAPAPDVREIWSIQDCCKQVNVPEICRGHCLEPEIPTSRNAQVKRLHACSVYEDKIQRCLLHLGAPKPKGRKVLNCIFLMIQYLSIFLVVEVNPILCFDTL